MSVSEALNSFTIEVVVAGKHNALNKHIIADYPHHSNFLSKLDSQSNSFDL
jgi:hypothetical protein